MSAPAEKSTRQMIRVVMSTRCRAMAALQLELAASLAKSADQGPLTRHFQQSAELLIQASMELRNG